MIFLPEPTIARLEGYGLQRKDLEKFLSYLDKRLDFELGKTKKSLQRFLSSRSREALIQSLSKETYDLRVKEMSEKVQRLTAERKKVALFEDSIGLYVHSGLAHKIAEKFVDEVQILYNLPEAKPLPWANPPKHKDRDYQVQAHDLLLRAAAQGPCGVELATGGGKSSIIKNLIKTLGLGTVVMTPSVSIAGQLYADLVYAFGKKYVGMYGGGKHEYDKLIVVGIDDSLTKVEAGTPAWEALSQKPVYIADESHLTPASSLQKVCLTLCSQAPYRFFFSGTQMRNDGLDVILDSITGRIVLKKTVKELVDEGYLARPHFKMVKLVSNSSYSSPDPVRMTRQHLYYNPVVYKTAAELANKFVGLMKRPVIILIEELEQFKRLLPHLKHLAKFAHGPLTAASKVLVPEAYHADKPMDLVHDFNQGKIPILVGTSCIATGTDIQVAEAGIYLMGGRSEIKIKQGVGRETRGGLRSTVFNPWTGKQKVDCVHVDFDVVNIDHLTRHAEQRAAVYEDIYGPVEPVNMTNRI